jgi:hypothetical protein
MINEGLGEGLWRIMRYIDNSTQLVGRKWLERASCFDSVVCLPRGQVAASLFCSSGIGQPVGLAEDGPTLHAYRSLHFFMLNVLEVKEVKASVPPSVVQCIAFSIGLLIIASCSFSLSVCKSVRYRYVAAVCS